MIKTNIIKIAFFKSNRKNAKMEKRLFYQYDYYSILHGLYNIIDTYIFEAMNNGKKILA